MKRKAIIFTLSTLIVCLFGFIVFKIKAVNDENNHLKLSKQFIPPFQFYTLDSALFNNKYVLAGKSSVCIIYFNTDCDHCQYEAEQINSHIGEFKNSKILMVSPNTPNDILEFGIKYKLTQHKQVTLLWDKNSKFTYWFGNAIIPSIYIYNKKFKLMKEYHGEAKIEAITKYL